MTDARIAKVVSESIAASVTPARPPASGGDNKIFITVIGGLALWFLTTQLNKTDSTSLQMATMSNQVSSLTATVNEVKADIGKMGAEMSTARIDPFTGKNGSELETRVVQKIDRAEENLESQIKNTNERVRSLENQLMKLVEL